MFPFKALNPSFCLKLMFMATQGPIKATIHFQKVLLREQLKEREWETIQSAGEMTILFVFPASYLMLWE